MVRNDDLRKDQTSMGIIDAQSVPNANSSEEKGYDGGKKISGIKRHIVTDTLGLPHAILVTTANITDREGALKMLSLNLSSFTIVEKFVVDGGYTGENFAKAVKKLTGAEVEVVKRSEMHKFVVLPVRWIVERSFGWIDNARAFGKTVNGLCTTHFKWLLLRLSAFY